MFGGGPKKEKKEEAEEPTDEPSGSSKAQKANDEVYQTHLIIGLLGLRRTGRLISRLLGLLLLFLLGTWERGLVPLSPDSGVNATKPFYASANDYFSSAHILA
jgi:hypothetical protein